MSPSICFCTSSLLTEGFLLLSFPAAIANVLYSEKFSVSSKARETFRQRASAGKAASYSSVRVICTHSAEEIAFVVGTGNATQVACTLYG